MDVSTNRELATLAAYLLEDMDREWALDGKMVKPSVEQVEKTLELLASMVKGKDQTTAETGNLLVRSDGNHIDVYIRLGEYNG